MPEKGKDETRGLYPRAGFGLWHFFQSFFYFKEIIIIRRRYSERERERERESGSRIAFFIPFYIIEKRELVLENCTLCVCVLVTCPRADGWFFSEKRKTGEVEVTKCRAPKIKRKKKKTTRREQWRTKKI